jgi:hypothetical protein
VNALLNLFEIARYIENATYFVLPLVYTNSTIQNLKLVPRYRILVIGLGQGFSGSAL